MLRCRCFPWNYSAEHCAQTKFGAYTSAFDSNQMQIKHFEMALNKKEGGIERQSGGRGGRAIGRQEGER